MSLFLQNLIKVDNNNIPNWSRSLAVPWIHYAVESMNELCWSQYPWGTLICNYLSLHEWRVICATYHTVPFRDFNARFAATALPISFSLYLFSHFPTRLQALHTAMTVTAQATHDIHWKKVTLVWKLLFFICLCKHKLWHCTRTEPMYTTSSSGQEKGFGWHDWLVVHCMRKLSFLCSSTASSSFLMDPMLTMVRPDPASLQLKQGSNHQILLKRVFCRLSPMQEHAFV